MSVVDYVDSWPHWGHVISNTGEDRLDIINSAISLCAQINDVLCNCKSASIIIKMKLLMSHCTSYYGAELLDLGNKSINDVCVTWRKRLRRVWVIVMDTHIALLAPMCNTSDLLASVCNSSDLLALVCNSTPIFDELCRRNSDFNNSCLISDSFFWLGPLPCTVFISVE